MNEKNKYAIILLAKKNTLQNLYYGNIDEIFQEYKY